MIFFDSNLIQTSPQDLRQLAQREGKKFAGSTSSLSGILSQIYFLISGDKKVDISTLSKSFPSDVSAQMLSGLDILR